MSPVVVNLVPFLSPQKRLHLFSCVARTPFHKYTEQTLHLVSTGHRLSARPSRLADWLVPWYGTVGRAREGGGEGGGVSRSRSCRGASMVASTVVSSRSLECVYRVLCERWDGMGCHPCGVPKRACGISPMHVYRILRPKASSLLLWSGRGFSHDLYCCSSTDGRNNQLRRPV